jgi:hypothetical protein
MFMDAQAAIVDSNSRLFDHSRRRKVVRLVPGIHGANGQDSAILITALLPSNSRLFVAGRVSAQSRSAGRWHTLQLRPIGLLRSTAVVR